MLAVIAGDSVQGTVSIQAQNGFSGSVALSISGLPGGVAASFTSNPILPNQTADLVIQTNTNTAVQNASLQIQGMSGSVSNKLTASLSVLARPLGVATRLGYVSVDAPLFDAIYDPIRHLAFAANPQLNRVEVFSPASRTRIGTIPVAQAVTLDTTPDGSRLWVGTTGKFLVAVDTATMSVVDRVLAGSGALGPLAFGRMLSTTANGSLLIINGSPSLGPATLVQVFPSTGTMIDRTRDAGAVGSGNALFRSADGSKVLVANFGAVGLYDAATDSFQTTTAVGGSDHACIRPDGSQIAVESTSKTVPGSADLVFLNSQLQEVGRVTGTNFAGMPVYSRDGRFLYIPEDITILRTSPTFTVIDTRTFTRVGKVPDLFLTSDPPTWHYSTPGGTTLAAADETGLLMGPGPRGFDFIDATNPQNLGEPHPGLAFDNRFGATVPRQGPQQRDTPVTLSGTFLDNPTIFFGDAPAGLLSATASTLQVLAPASGGPGPSNITATFPNGWTTLAPYAYSYGPQAQYMIPTGDRPSGGSRVTIFGYGLDFPASQIAVTIGGRPAKVESSQLVIPNAILTTPIFSLIVDVPSGAPGIADVVISTPVGSTTLPGAFHYLKSVQDIPLSGTFTQILFDRLHRLLYLLDKGNARVEVLSADTLQLQTPFATGSSPTEMALSADGSSLIIANTGDGTLSLIDPTNKVNSRIVPAGIPGDTRNFQPVHIAATASGKVFVNYLSAQISTGQLRVLDLNSLTFSPVPTDPGCFISGCLMESMAGGHKVFFAVIGNSGGSIFQWDDDASNFVNLRGLGDFLSAEAVAEDANRITVDTRILNRDNQLESQTSLVDLLAEIASPLVAGRRVHPSGGLLYLPQVDGVLLFDLQNATVARAYSGLNLAATQVGTIAIDETGQIIYAISPSGIEVATLDSVPLTLGHVSPEAGPSAGGTPVTLRGSGFTSGTQANFGGVPVTPTFVDSNTIKIVTPKLTPGRVRVSVIQSGERYDLDAAFQAN